MNNNNQLSFLDILTILSFVVGLYALELAKQNLVENRLQSKNSEEILHQLERTFKSTRRTPSCSRFTLKRARQIIKKGGIE